MVSNVMDYQIWRYKYISVLPRNPQLRSTQYNSLITRAQTNLSIFAKPTIMMSSGLISNQISIVRLKQS